MQRILSLVGLVLHTFSVPVAEATNPFSFVPCAGLPGCGGGLANVPMALVVTVVARLLEVTTALTVLMVVWSGVKMLLGMGDEGVETKSRWSITYALLGLALSLSAGTVVSLVTTETFFGGGDLPTSVIANITRIALILFNSVFAAVAVIAGARMVLAAGKSDEFGRGVTMLRAAIIGAIVVNMAKVIVQAFLSLPHGLA